MIKIQTKQMRKYIFLLMAVIALSSCNKDDSEVDVTYRVSSAYSETIISYTDETGIMNTDTVNFDSGEDIRSYSFSGEKGDIVYVSAIYTDSASSVKVEILLDGKIYKSGSSNNEPGKYVIVSGTIPY